MVDFTRTKRVETEEPAIKVDPGLKEGHYVFQLTVIDQDGNKSRPAQIKVEIKRDLIIIDPRLVDPVLREPILREPIIPIDPIIR
jgi:hypothetical protein